ncbi:MAG TPA: hypothetical protein VFI18_01120 [Gaiellales bacterium]|nr:hypothetical protein [Gaiellales bacterium]
MNEASASAREALGADHPLVRIDAATTVAERQTLVCAAFLLATVAAACPDIARVVPLVGSAAAVDLTLLALVALLRRQRRLQARSVIIQRGPLHLPCVQSEMARLAHQRTRSRLAARLRKAVGDAEGWHSLLVASRPPVGILELLPHVGLVRNIADHLDANATNIRGIALADRLLDDGYASPLYAGDGYRLGYTLRQILYELDR